MRTERDRPREQMLHSKTTAALPFPWSRAQTLTMALQTLPEGALPPLSELCSFFAPPASLCHRSSLVRSQQPAPRDSPCWQQPRPLPQVPSLQCLLALTSSLPSSFCPDFILTLQPTDSALPSPPSWMETLGPLGPALLLLVSTSRGT